MTQIALVTARAARQSDTDLDRIIDALATMGVSARAVCWDDPSARWSDYALAIIRSTWDYVPRYDEFLGWLTRASSLVTLLNPPRVVRWSMDKRYLRDLARRGIPVVPTMFVEPGDDIDMHVVPGAEWVVKPVVSAGARDTARHSSAAAVRRHVAGLLAQQRPVMVQPYQPRVDTDGETGLVYIEGQLSHAFCKGALLDLDAAPIDRLHAPEMITPRIPSRSERDVADAVVDAFAGDLIYARVDLVPDADGNPLVLEVELAEPSLFLELSAGSTERFAEAIARRLASRSDRDRQRASSPQNAG